MEIIFRQDSKAFQILEQSERRTLSVVNLQQRTVEMRNDGVNRNKREKSHFLKKAEHFESVE